MSCPYFYNKKERKNCSFYAQIGSPKKEHTTRVEMHPKS